MKVLEQIEKYLLALVILLFPIFTLAATSAPLAIPREVLLVAGVSIVLLLHLIKSIIKGELTFSLGEFDLAVFLVIVGYLLSAIIKTPNKTEAFFFPGAATLVIASAIFYILLNQFKKEDKTFFLTCLIVSGALLSLATLLVQIRFFSKIPGLPAFIQDPNFNPTGGVIPSLIYLLTLIPVSVGFVINQKDFTKKLFFAVSAAIILAGLTVNISSILPGKPQSPRFLPADTSWEISIDALKESPILGMGPANFLTAFNKFRPLSYNGTDLWPIKFATASNFYLTAITEVGLIGALALILLFLAVYRQLSKDKFSFEKGSLIMILAIFIILPASAVSIFIMFAVLALESKSEEKTVELIKGGIRIPVAITAIPIFAGIVAVVFMGSNLLRAELAYQKALEYASKNDAKSTFENLTVAIKLDPKSDRYHSTLSQLDLLLASGIAAKKDITDTDRSTVSQLIQAAIDEGKATVALNPTRSGNWELLAIIYRSIMPFAQGADNFALQTFSQAVLLDPINPNLRISLGGTYYALGRYDDAISVFKLAIAAKPDLANSHYNLAIAYREKKDYDNAITEMNNVLSLVKQDSQDYTLAKNTLDELQKSKAAVKPAGSSENLNAPQPAGTSNIKPPIELPKEATPPATKQ